MLVKTEFYFYYKILNKYMIAMNLTCLLELNAKNVFFFNQQ